MTLLENVELFATSCIHCLSSNGGGEMPRPYVLALFVTKPDELAQFDYTEFGPSSTGK